MCLLSDPVLGTIVEMRMNSLLYPLGDFDLTLGVHACTD